MIPESARSGDQQPDVGNDGVGPRESVLLLELARATVRASVLREAAPEPERAMVPAALQAPRGCFVTLRTGRELRGCIGHITAQQPLWRAVIENARNAASHDTRFAPIRRDELDELAIGISVLSEPVEVRPSSPEDFPDLLEPGRDGVVLEIEGRRVTFLPQVWESLPDRREFLRQLSEKGGWPGDAWTRRDARVWTYTVQSFGVGD